MGEVGGGWEGGGEVEGSRSRLSSEFHTASSSLPSTLPSSLPSCGSTSSLEVFHSTSSSPCRMLGSAGQTSDEEEDEEMEEDEEEGRKEEVQEEVAAPLYIGSRELELEERGVHLRLYSEAGAGVGAGAGAGAWCGLGSVDLVGLVYRGEEELASTLARAGGAWDFLTTYWTGFYPLLLLHLAGEGEAVGAVGAVQAAVAREAAVAAVRVVVAGGRAEREWGLEAAARLHLHRRTCRGEGEGGLEAASWRCPTCPLTSTNPRQRPARSTKPRGFLRSVRRTIAARRLRPTS